MLITRLSYSIVQSQKRNDRSQRLHLIIGGVSWWWVISRPGRGCIIIFRLSRVIRGLHCRVVSWLRVVVGLLRKARWWFGILYRRSGIRRKVIRGLEITV